MYTVDFMSEVESWAQPKVINDMLGIHPSNNSIVFLNLDFRE